MRQFNFEGLNVFPAFSGPGNFFYYHSHTTPDTLDCFSLEKSCQCFHITCDFLISGLTCKSKVFFFL